VIIIILSSGFLILRRQLAPLEVKWVFVKKQALEVTVTATSTGIVKSETEVNITAQRTGKIARLLVEEGDKVDKGDLIAELDTAETIVNLTKSEAEVKKAEIELINTRTEYKRKSSLFKEGLITQEQFDDVSRRLSIAEAELERSKAARDAIQLQLEYSFIKTPVKGVVSKRPVNVGDTVIPGPIIASIVDPDNLYIEAPIDEADVSSVALRQRAKITVDAYHKKVFYGRVTKISPIVIGAKQEARTFVVRVSLIDTNKIILKPGMSADVEIITGVAKDTLVVPSQVIVEKGQEKIVYVYEKGRAKPRKVKIGIYNWNFTEIKEGLKEGEKVIIIPDKPGFKEGVKVKLVDST